MMSEATKAKRRKQRSLKRKAEKKHRKIIEKKLLRYLAKPGYVGNMIMLPVNKISADDHLSSFSTLIYGELYTIFNTTDRFQLNRQLLLRPISHKRGNISKVTTALHQFDKMGLISIDPVHYKKSHSKKPIGYLVVNKGLNSRSANTKVIKTDQEVSQQKHKYRKPKIQVAYEVINYINHKTGRKWRYTTYEGSILAREKSGYKLGDFKKVIDYKYIDWWNSPKMHKFVRPSTLFGSEKHFENYLNEALDYFGRHPNQASNPQSNQKKGRGYNGVVF